jgi:hypothetical protein
VNGDGRFDRERTSRGRSSSRRRHAPPAPAFAEINEHDVSLRVTRGCARTRRRFSVFFPRARKGGEGWGLGRLVAEPNLVAWTATHSRVARAALDEQDHGRRASTGQLIGVVPASNCVRAQTGCDTAGLFLSELCGSCVELCPSTNWL